MPGSGIKVLLKVAAGLLALLLASVAALLLYLELADLGAHRQLAEAAGGALLGREVRLDGPVRLDLGTTIELSADRLRIGNPRWLPDPWMLDLAEARISLDLWSIFRGPLRFRRIHIGGGKALVHRDEELGINWQFDAGNNAVEDEPAATIRAGFPLIVEDMDAQNLEVLLRGPRIPEGVSLGISRFAIHREDGDVLQVNANGLLQQHPWKLGGTLGTLAALTSGRDLQVDLALEAAGSHLEFLGKTESLGELQGLDTSLTIRGPALELITRTFGLPGIAQGPYEIILTARDTGSAHDLNLQAAAGDFGVSMQLEVAGAFTDTPVMDLSAHARGPDFGAVADLFGIAGLAHGPFTLDGEFHHDGEQTTFREVVLKSNQNSVSVNGRLGAAPDYLGTSMTLQLDLQDISAVARRFGIRRFTARPASLGATLTREAGGLMLQHGHLALGEDSLRASGTLGNLAQLQGGALDISASVKDLQSLGRFAGLDGLPRLPVQATGKIASANGVLEVLALDARTDGGDLGIRGTLGSLNRQGRARLELALKLDDMRAISDRTAWLPALPTEPLSGGAVLLLDSEAARFSKISLYSPLAELSGEAFIPLSGGELVSRITAVGEGPDLHALGQAAGVDYLPRSAFKTDAQLEFFSDRVHFTRWQISAGTLTMDNSNSTITFAQGLIGSVLQSEASGADARSVYAPLADYLRQTQPFRLRTRLQPTQGGVEIGLLSGQFADVDFDARGRFGLAAGLANTELELTLSTPSLARTAAALLDYPVPDEPARASGKLLISDRGFAARDVQASLGVDSLRVQAEYTRGTPNQAKFDIAGDALDLDRILAMWALLENGTSPSRADDGRIIPDVALPVAWLSGLQGEASIDIRELQFQNRLFKDVVGSGLAGSGKLSLGPLRAGLGGGALEVSINAETIEGELQGELAVSARDIRPELIKSSISLSQRPPADIGLRLTGRGKTLRQLAASASGPITLAIGPGIYEDAIDLLTSDVLTQLVGALNPFTQAEAAAEFECGLLVMTAREGVLDSEVILLQTKPTLTGAVAKIDLRSENIEVIFNVMVRQGLGLSMSSITNPYIKIAGTLGKPSLTFAPTRAAISYGAAVATGGLSIVLKGFVDRILSGGRVCEGEIKKRNLRLPGSDS